jgi:hypothetical protein
MTTCDLLVEDYVFSELYVTEYELDDAGALTSFTSKEHFMVTRQVDRVVRYSRVSEYTWQAHRNKTCFLGTYDSRPNSYGGPNEFQACLIALHKHLVVTIILE